MRNTLKQARCNMRTQRLAAVLLCACATLLFDAGAIAAGKPQTHQIVIDGLKYEPETLTVKRGDTIVWTNKDPFPHTVTAQGKFDSHDIPADGTWKYVARTTGEYAYICTLHSNMKGVLRVE
ncbi:MAG: cupredoxin family copper-binding protein [Burkholderiales bacterium]|jgi:plastocyanin